jgi:hypothetical protein
MAKYRQVHLTFWQDPFIEELEPLEKYFYLYLMTNSKTTQCGCYEISMKLMKYETGLKQSQIDSFIKLFEDCNKIGFNKNNSEFIIINWLKHNSFKSPRVKTCIENELSNIKTVFYKDYINGILNGINPIDSLSIPLNKVSDTIDTQSQQEQEQKEEQEREEEVKKEPSPKTFKQWNKDDFWDELVKINEDNKYTVEMIQEFYIYWAEPNDKNKMRLQLEKTWSTNGRLSKWSKNNFSNQGSFNLGQQKHESVGQMLRSSEPVKIAPRVLNDDGTEGF